MIKGILSLVFCVITLLGGVYWIYIYCTKEGQIKRDDVGKYTLLDRIFQVIFFHMTLLVCVLNILVFGNLRVIK